MMSFADLCRLGCLLVLLSSGCSGDDDGAAGAPVTGRDGGGARDGGSRGQDDAPADTDTDTDTDDDDDAPGDAGGGSDSGAGPATTDAAAPPQTPADAGTTPEPPSDGGPAADASDPAGGCQSLSACCEQLNPGLRMICLGVVEGADDAVCAELARVACPAPDGGGPAGDMPCSAVLECCAGLEGRRQMACEAAAEAAEGRACERAMEMYCEQ